MKMRNILALTVVALVLCFASCKPEEEDPILKSVIQGKITWEDDESGQAGDGMKAKVALHSGNNETALTTVTANDTGFYQISGITVVVNDTSKVLYQVSAEFKRTFGATVETFIGRSPDIELKGNDTVICDLHLKR
jgi:hypothetical protein